MKCSAKSLPEPKLPTTKPAWTKPAVEYPKDATIIEIPYKWVPEKKPKPRPKAPEKPKTAPKRKRNRILSGSDGKKQRWTDEEIQVLVSLYNDDVPYAEILDQLTRHSKGTIKCKVIELRKKGLITGIRTPYWTAEQLEKLVRLRKAGTSWEKISKEIGKSRSACCQKYLKLEEK